MNLLQRLKLAGSVLRTGSSFTQAFTRGDDLDGQRSGLAYPYAQSAWVMRAIKKVSGPISNVPCKFYEGDDEVEDEALVQLLQKPCGYSPEDFFEAMVGWLKLSGETFLILDDSFLLADKSANPAGVVLARPDRMREIVRGGVLEGWVFTDGANRQWPLLPEQVLHTKFWNPYNEWRGLSEYGAARIAAQADYEAGKFGLHLMESNGDQGVYVIAKNGIPTDAQREQIVASLRDKRDSQRRGQFKPLFLTGDISIEDPQVRALDAAYNETRRMSRHEIFTAFGVPPSMADKMESYSVGSASDWYILIFETCIPTGKKVVAPLDVIAQRLTGRRVTAELDWDEHPVMQQVRRERLQSGDSLWAKGMPLSAINEYLDLGLPEFAGWEVGYLPFSVAPTAEMQINSASPDGLSEELEPGEEVVPSEDSGEVQEMRRALLGLSAEPHTCAPRDPQELKRWRALMRQRAQVVANYQRKYSRVLHEARTQVLQKIEAIGRRTPLARASAADFMFDLTAITDLLKAEMRKAAGFAFDLAGKQALAELKRDDPWSMPPAKATQFFNERENRISGMAEDVFSDVMGTLQEGIGAGDSIKDLSDRVRAKFNQADAGRAKRIAMTETGAAYSVARQEAFEQSGVPFKKWLTSGGLNVRAAHRDANHQTVPMRAKFKVVNPETGAVDYVDQPGDPRGAAWNIINCHCVAVAVEGPESSAEPLEGDPIYAED